MVQFSLTVGNSLSVHGVHLEEETETCLCAFQKQKILWSLAHWLPLSKTDIVTLSPGTP
jgi:hypothetical protein